MQMVKKSVIAFIVAWFMILLLMPKQGFYYKLEEELAKHEIILNESKIDDGIFTLNLEKVTVYVKGINVATVEKLNLFTLLFYSRITLETLQIDDSLKAMAPQEIENAVVQYFIYSPLSVLVDAVGSFGSMSGNIDLNERQIYLDFNESDNIEMLKPKLKKGEKGWHYETSF